MPTNTFVQVRVPVDLWEEALTYGWGHRLSGAEVVRAALADYLKRKAPRP